MTSRLRITTLFMCALAPLVLAAVSQIASPPAASALGAPSVRVVGNQVVDGSGKSLRLLGVDVSGTQDACIQGKGFGWGTLDSVEAASIATWHADVVRVPLNEDCWLGINGVPAAYSGAPYQAAIGRWVQALHGAGIVVILELYSAAPGTYPATGQWPMADTDHSITFWSQVSAAFAHDPSVIYDLFNEPFIGRMQPTASDWNCWLNGCATGFAACLPGQTQPCPTVTYQTAGIQQLVTAVRASGSTQPIMLGGLNWSGDPCGVRDAPPGPGTCAWLRYQPTDPAHQLIDDFHTYNWTACRDVLCWTASVAPLAAAVPVVTGEFGQRTCGSGYVRRYMKWADQNGVSYLALSWQPPAAGSSCRAASLDLLANWKGVPGVVSPVGPVFQNHLGALFRAGALP